MNLVCQFYHFHLKIYAKLNRCGSVGTGIQSGLKIPRRQTDWGFESPLPHQIYLLEHIMFICQFCGRQFDFKSAYTQHEKYHCQLNPNRQKVNQIKFYTKHKKASCKLCGKLFDVANLHRHEVSCGKVDNQRHVSHDGLNCEFCGKLCKNKNSLAQHEIRCRENPERKDFNNLALFVNQESSEAKAIRYKACQETLRTRIASGEVNYDNNIRTKYKFGTYCGYHCDSSWELAFVIYNLDHNIKFVRNTERFPYIHKGSIHYYYPDFIIQDTYYEIKSYFDDRVQAKCEAFPKDKSLVILDQSKIQIYLSYCEKTYGKDFTTLYDRSSPSWMDLKED